MKTDDTKSNSSIKDPIFELRKDLTDKLSGKSANDGIFIEIGTIEIQSDDDIKVADDIIWDSLSCRTVSIGDFW